MLKVFQKQEDPKELIRKWQAESRKEMRQLDREIRDIKFEEKKILKSIKDAAKRNDIANAKSLAKEVVQSRKAVSRLYTNKAHMMNIEISLAEQLAMVRMAGTLSKSAEVMKAVNAMMKLPHLQESMVQMSKEMMKAGIIDEMMTDMLESVLEVEGEDDDAELEVQKVLQEIAVEMASQLPNLLAKASPSMNQKTVMEDNMESSGAEATLEHAIGS